VTLGDQVLRHGKAIGLLAVAAALGGVVVSSTLPKGVYPEVSYPREQVVAEVPGGSAAAVLATVTRRLEEELTAVPGVERVRSKTVRGAAELSLFFAPDTDMVQAHAAVLARVAEARAVLPPDVEVEAQRVLPSGFPVLSFNVEGPLPPGKLYELAQYTLRPALIGLPGVGLVTVQSSDVPELQVRVDPQRLAAAHLTVKDVAAAIQASNVLATVARLDDAHQLALGIVDGEVRGRADLEQVVVGGDAAHPLRVRDVGEVVEASRPRTSLVRVDGRPGAIVNVSRRLGGDAIAMEKAVLAKLAEVSLPPGVKVVRVYDQAEFVLDGVTGVRDAVLFGAVLAVLALALFIRDVRALAVAALSLPLTLGATLLALHALGQTVNLMTLGGMAIAVGLVIDDAVVVVEGVHRHLERGASAVEATRAAVESLFGAVVGTTLTTVVVFLPLGLLQGVAGQFFVALSLSLPSAVLISLPVALAVLPPLAARWLRPVPAPPPAAYERFYARVLDRLLPQRRWVFVGAAAVSVAGMAGLWWLPSEFLPEADEGGYVVDYFAPVGASLEEADALATRAEDVIRRTPEVESYSRRLGAELGPPVATLSSSGDIAVRLKRERDRDSEEIMDEQRAGIAAAVPGLRVEFIQVLADMLGDLEGSAEPVEVKLFGPDFGQLGRLARELDEKLKDAPGFVDVFNGDEGCAPELRMRVDAPALHRAGLTAQQLEDQVGAAFLGEPAGAVRLPDHLEEIRVVSAWAESPRPGALERYPVSAASPGSSAPLATFGRAAPACDPAVLLRENQRNMVHYTARLSGTSLGEAAAEVRRRLSGWQLPPGYSWELGGLAEQQRDSFRALLEVVAIAVGGVLVVLLFLLRRLGWSLAVLAAVPVAVAGAVLAMSVTGEPLNVSSVMGMLLLVGLVVKNGILLLDHALVAEEQGHPRPEAVRMAARERLRPILMTTTATLVGLLPLVFGSGVGAALHRSLALVVVGGLALSTAATLVLVPALASLQRARGATVLSKDRLAGHQ